MDNTQRRVIAFAKVLSTLLNEDVYEYKNKEAELTETLIPSQCGLPLIWNCKIGNQHNQTPLADFDNDFISNIFFI